MRKYWVPIGTATVAFSCGWRGVGMHKIVVCFWYNVSYSVFYNVFCAVFVYVLFYGRCINWNCVFWCVGVLLGGFGVFVVC